MQATIVIAYVRGLITPLTTTHEPPSRAQGLVSMDTRVSNGLTMWRLFPQTPKP